MSVVIQDRVTLEGRECLKGPVQFSRPKSDGHDAHRDPGDVAIRDAIDSALQQ